MDTPIKILLVEDSVDDVDVLRRFIRRLPGSYRVDIAYTGAEAIERVSGRAYDVTLVDHRLPDVSGQSLIERLREVVPELPIVMLTGHGDERLAVEVMKAGAYDYVRKDDLNQQMLGRTLHNVLERARLEAEVRRANERLREWAIRDGLTGLYNHRHFQELLRNEFARAARYGRTLACMMVDLDHFKQINDTHGHPFGDEVLQRVARCLVEGARQVDIVARYGGEEFVLVLPNTEAEGARLVGDRIRQAVAAERFEHEGTPVPVTLSVGVATNALADVVDERSLVKRADAALYAAKRGGRNQVVVAGVQAPAAHPTPVPAAPTSPVVQEEVRRRLVDALAQLADAAANRLYAGHPRRVAELAVRFGRFLGLDDDQLSTLEAGALLHDIGRVAVSDTIWLKPGPLTPDEVERVRAHVELGAEVVERTGLAPAEVEIVRHHHERWDGKGYPAGLAGGRIPLLARIVALVDAFEALTSPRPWRAARTAADALAELRSLRGTVYDPELTAAFERFVQRDLAPQSVAPRAVAPQRESQ